MKMIDFTPLVTMGYKKVLTRLAIASFAVALAVKMAGYQELASGLALGGAVGLLDTLIMFVGIQRSLPQGEPEAALKNHEALSLGQKNNSRCFSYCDVKVEIPCFWCMHGVSADTYIFNI